MPKTRRKQVYKWQYKPEIKDNPEKQARLEKAWRFIDENPGVSIIELRECLGCHTQNLLMALERSGYLLAEKDDRLWTFASIGREAYNYLMFHQLALYGE